MLARLNRVTRPNDFRAAIRRGRRVSGAHCTIHVFARESGAPTRFGFIVTKAVGGAVTRNQVRRRMRAACRELLPTIPLGRDIVVRALPGCEQLEWSILHGEISQGIDKAMAHA